MMSSTRSFLPPYFWPGLDSDSAEMMDLGIRVSVSVVAEKVHL